MNQKINGIEKDNWHSADVATIFERLNTKEQGLTTEEVQIKFRNAGPNILPTGKEKGVLSIFFGQFRSALIYILIIAALAVTLLGEFTDGAIIFFVLFANALIGTFQEGKAKQALRSLRQFTKGLAVVLRDGVEKQILDEDLVPGDIVIIRDGDKIPADARLLSSHGLKINESTLTGESTPVDKDSKLCQQTGSILERKNMIYKGTLCVSGHARAVVITTGSNTFVGQISKKLVNVEEEMPLKAKIRSFSKILALSVLFAVIFIIIVGLIKGIAPREIFFVGVAIAVSLIPEGLPVVITLILAKGVYQMAKRNALIKNMQAIEALGQANILAVDKTGTITKNELMVEKVYVNGQEFKVLGSGFKPQGSIILGDKIIDPANHQELLFAGKVATFCANADVEILANDEAKVIGDPTEAALLVFGEKTGFKKEELESEEPQILDIPFGSKYRFHSTLHKSKERFFLSVVGAPEDVLLGVSRIWSVSGERDFTDNDNRTIHDKIKEFSSLGLRVIAFAFHNGVEAVVDVEKLPPLTFGGLYAMADVLREEITAAVSEVSENGVKTTMITGDFAGTAEAIAKQAGIFKTGDRVMTGADIDRLSLEEFSHCLDKVTVFARVLPEHKLKIVEAYKKRGDVVGMTGDGVNDALPLQAAHLGIAMGKGGTDVAKEAADIVLLDNNFKSIVAAIEEGRSIYATIKKVILYLVSTSLGEFFSIAGALIIGLPLPLYPSQIIWLNLVTDGFVVVALAFEPRVLLRHSGRGTSLMTKTAMIRAFIMGLTMMAGTLIVFSVFHQVSNLQAWTVSLTILAVFQWFNAWNVRSKKMSAFNKPFSNKYLILGIGGAVLAQIFAVYHPFMQQILRTTSLNLMDWVIIVALASSVLLVEEIRKLFVRLKENRAFLHNS